MSYGKPKTYFEISWVKNPFFYQNFLTLLKFLIQSSYKDRVNSDNNGHIT